MEIRTLYDGAVTATSRRCTEWLDGAGEVASRECVADERSDGLEPRRPIGGEIVEHLAIARDDLSDRLVGDVEHGVKTANPCPP